MMRTVRKKKFFYGDGQLDFASGWWSRTCGPLMPVTVGPPEESVFCVGTGARQLARVGAGPRRVAGPYRCLAHCVSDQPLDAWDWNCLVHRRFHNPYASVLRCNCKFSANPISCCMTREFSPESPDLDSFALIIFCFQLCRYELFFHIFTVDH